MLENIEQEDKEYIVYSLGAVIIFLVIYLIIKKRNGTRQFEEVMEIIEKKKSGRDIVDISKFDKDTNFKPDKWVTQIYNAYGIFYDDDDVIFDTFCNTLTKGQIKSVADAFQKKYGVALDYWLKNEMFGNSWVDKGKYEKVARCIANAT